LIDYSLFLIQVDRQVMIENLTAQTPVLSFDKVKGQFNVSMQDVSLRRPSASESSAERKLAPVGNAHLKSSKNAVFRVVETNESLK
jgi:hypothetical protein